MKVRYNSRFPVHAEMNDGSMKTLYDGMVLSGVKSIPKEGEGYYTILDEPKIETPKIKVKKKVKKNGN